jgi:D-methionine transport system ATP-binding protein
MIRLEGINKKFFHGGKDLLAINNVDLHVQKGTILGVIGESGAGKSSLLRSVNLLERPDSGRVMVAGKELTNIPEHELRRARQRIGMIFQHFNLLGSCSVFDNIALPLKLMGKTKSAIKDAVTPLLKLTGLVGKEMNYPHQLSGGQRQRVAIARALATEPMLLLSDEATSALDPKTTDSILDLLREINENTGLTILLVTHELYVIKKICHQVALMDQGRIIETSSVIDFFATPKSDLAKEIVAASLKMNSPVELRHRSSKYVF